MLTNRQILGVGPGQLQTADDQTDAKYLPASAMTEQMIRGVDWKPFRLDANGQQWYQRDDGSETPIHAELNLENFDDGDDAQIDNSDILESFRRECALIKARHSRGELPDSTEDSDEFGYPNG